MNEEKEKLSKIKWWHLLGAGYGLNLLLGSRDSLSLIMIGILGDVLVVIGLVWGLKLGIAYLIKKLQNK